MVWRISILLFLSLSINAQYVVNGSSNGFTNGSGYRLTSAGPVRYVTQEPSENWTILYQWDFKTFDYGTTTSGDLIAYMGEYPINGLDWDQDTIVDATIDGVESKAQKIIATTHWESMQFLTEFKDIGVDSMDKVMYTFHVRLDPGFESPDNNMKLPGLIGGGLTMETFINYPALSTDGSTMGLLLKEGLQLQDYFYTHNDIGYGNCGGTGDHACPWTTGLSGVYLAPGTWYEITIYLVMNSVGNSDGVFETYVNGTMITQCDTMRYRQNTNYKISGLKYSFFCNPNPPSKTISWTTDNHIIYDPVGDDDYDAGTAHDPGYTLTSPNTLTDRDFYYDHLETTDGTYSTAGWPCATASGWHEAWRFTGSTNVEITFAGALGSNDYLFIIDGATTDDDLDYALAGSIADISTSFDGGGATYTSTGTDVIVYTVNSEDTGVTKFSMTVDIDP